MMVRRWRGRSRPAALLLAMGLLIGSLPALAADGTAVSDFDPLSKVEAEVLEALSVRGRGVEPPTYWLVLEDMPDLSPAYDIEDWAERGWFVYERLRQFTAASQAEAVEILDSAGVDYQPFWIVNVIKVSGGDLDLVTELASIPNVLEIVADRVTEIDLPEPADDEPTIQAVEWGIANTGANRVWDDFGVTGEGIVVGIIDTGTLYTHNALVNQYRGNNGDGTFDAGAHRRPRPEPAPGPAAPCGQQLLGPVHHGRPLRGDGQGLGGRGDRARLRQRQRRPRLRDRRPAGDVSRRLRRGRPQQQQQYRQLLQPGPGAGALQRDQAQHHRPRPECPLLDA